MSKRSRQSARGDAVKSVAAKVDHAELSSLFASAEAAVAKAHSSAETATYSKWALVKAILELASWAATNDPTGEKYFLPLFDRKKKRFAKASVIRMIGNLLIPGADEVKQYRMRYIHVAEQVQFLSKTASDVDKLSEEFTLEKLAADYKARTSEKTPAAKKPTRVTVEFPPEVAASAWKMEAESEADILVKVVAPGVFRAINILRAVPTVNVRPVVEIQAESQD